MFGRFKKRFYICNVIKKIKDMKEYTFIYKDKYGNELYRDYHFAYDIRQARELARAICNESPLDDLKKIVVRRTR